MIKEWLNRRRYLRYKIEDHTLDNVYQNFELRTFTALELQDIYLITEFSNLEVLVERVLIVERCLESGLPLDSWVNRLDRREVRLYEYVNGVDLGIALSKLKQSFENITKCIKEVGTSRGYIDRRTNGIVREYGSLLKALGNKQFGV